MSSKILDGKALAQLAEEDIKSHVNSLKENGYNASEKTSCLKKMIVVKRTGSKVNWKESRDF